MKTVSSFLLLISLVVFAGLTAVLAAIVAGHEPAVWLGGRGLLYVGVPVLSLALSCLFVGLALRPARRQAEGAGPRRESRPDRSAGLVALCLGLGLLAYIGFETMLFVAVWDRGLEISAGFLRSETPPPFWAALGARVFDLKLPVALGAMALGLRWLGVGPFRAG